MKKYILPFMSIAMLMAMASCSSSDDEVAEIKEESKLVPMTFTATQESNTGTRAELNGNSVDWQTGDKISVFDGTGAEGNRVFTLTDVETGKFSGTASSTATKFTAVYPYTSGATLESDCKVNGITLPAEQTATPNSFDPKAALMMAYTTDKSKLDFKNAVSLVKVTTDFPCKKIVLSANEYIAGTGTLTMTFNSANDTYTSSFTFSYGNSKTITLKPATAGDNIAIGTYYIVVPPITLPNGFSISFHASDEYCVYTRTSIKSNTFNRSKIKDFGTFKKTGNTWEWSHTSRGNVDASQEVDMGEFEIGGTNYRLIFTKSNLTKDGLANAETGYGDYFAWGAKEPWYSSINNSSSNCDDWTATWISGKEDGYVSKNKPTLSKEYGANEVLSTLDDTAHKILGGEWQIPTKAIWEALTNLSSKGWDTDKKGYVFENNGQTLFLPAAGFVGVSSFFNVGSIGYYWTGTASSSTCAYHLYFNSGGVDAQADYYRCHGFSVRPVRLVAVD